MISGKEHSGDRVIALQKVEQNGLVLQTLSEEFRDDKQIVLAAINQNWKAVEFASPRVRSMPDVMLIAVRMDWRAQDLLVSRAEKFERLRRMYPLKFGLGLSEMPGNYQGLAERKETHERILKNLDFTDRAVEFINSRAFIEERVKQNGLLLANEYSEYNDDKELVTTAVRNNWRSLEYVSARLKEDPDVWSIAFNQNWQAIRYSDAIVTDDETIISEMCQSNVHNIRFGSERIRSNKEWFTHQIGKGDGSLLEYATEDLRDDEDLVLLAAKRGIRDSGSRNAFLTPMKFASERLRSDADLMLGIIRDHEVYNLKYASESILKDDAFQRTVAVIVVDKLKRLFRSIHLEDREWREIVPLILWDAEEFVRILVAENGDLLRLCSERVRGTKELVFLACVSGNCSGAFEFASDEIKGDKDFVLKLLNHKCLVGLRHLSIELRSDKEIVTRVLSEDISEIFDANPSIQIDDKEAISTALDIPNSRWSLGHYPSVLIFASERLRNDKEIVLKALKKSSMEYDYISDDLKSDPEVQKAYGIRLYNEEMDIEHERRDQAHMDWLYGLSNTCTSCQESPCICSDPSRTSSLSDW